MIHTSSSLPSKLNAWDQESQFLVLGGRIVLTIIYTEKTIELKWKLTQKVCASVSILGRWPVLDGLQ
jgi:hypothetical protein